MKLQGRPLYRHRDLDPILNPRRVAIVGISPSEKGAGARALGQLELLGFDGAIDLVNAKYETIGERPCHRSIASLDAAPDVVIITVPQAAVEDVLLDAVTGGAKAAIVFAAGYSDTGREDRRNMQERLSSIALESGLRIIGPNCLGAVNYARGAALTYTNTPLLRDDAGAVARPGPRAIGLVSQSGGLGFAAAQSVQRGVSISHILTSGNSCDVDIADYVAYLAEEPSCRAIACVFEAVPDAGRLTEAAELAFRLGKPVVVHKLGTGAQGAAAAMTHSGMLAGSHDAFLAAMESAGAIVVEDFEALVETAAYCAKADPQAADGVVVLTSSGGASVMAADEAERTGVPLPALDDKVRGALQQRLPDFGTARNPCDVTGGLANDLDGYTACADMLLAQPAFGTMITSHPYSVHTTNRVRAFAALAARHDKLVCNVWITEHLGGPGLVEAERDDRLAVFRSMRRCFATMAVWRQWRSRRAERLAEAPYRRLSDPGAAGRVAPLLAAAQGVITEADAKTILAAYGVAVVTEERVASPDAAADATARMGGKVVIKIDSPDIAHKTEAGLVALGVEGPEQAREAARLILANAAAHCPEARVDGLLVQPMVEAGVEVAIGARSDPVYGPMILVGLGGVLIELLKDRRLAPVPLSPERALALIDDLASSPLLDGYRGGPKVDRARLAETIARVSEFLADHRDMVAELDINPVICRGESVIAVDALIVTAAPPVSCGD